MTRRLNWMMAAAIGVGGAALAGCDRNNTTASNTGDAARDTARTAKNVSPATDNPRDNTAAADNKALSNTTDAARTAGSQIPGDQIGSVDLNHIYNAVHEPVTAAFKNGNAADVADYFVKADRDRIGKMQKSDELKGSSDAFTKAWNAKYNAKFDVGDDVLKNWLQVQKTGETKDVTMANAVIPASHGLPEVRIPLVKDDLKWRLDVPDSLDGQKTFDAVKDSLYKAGQMSAQWPSDQLEAKRHVVHSFYANLFGVK